MKNDKFVLYAIIILLIIFLPLTVVSFYIKIGENPLDANPGHDFYYDNNLWFYNKNNDLIGKYACTTEKCDLTKTIIDDDKYGINYYQGGALNNVEIIDNKYTFITDGALNYLFSLGSSSTISNYKNIKDYHIRIENNTYIVQNKDDVWGAFTIGSNLGAVLPFEYDFIGLKNNVVNNELQAKKFIVLKDSKWFIVDNKNSALTSFFENPIIDYTDNYVISKQDDQIRIYNYKMEEYLTTYNFNECATFNNYIAVKDTNNIYVFNNVNNILKTINVSESGKLSLENNNNVLEIKIADKVLDTIALN